jgi:hypothetical protein
MRELGIPLTRENYIAARQQPAEVLRDRSLPVIYAIVT